MYRATLVTYTLLCSLSFLANADVRSAKALSWLEKVDAGHYQQSWQLSAKIFQTAITSAEWQQALQKVRAPLGEVKSRKFFSAVSHQQLPGVPPGDYVILKWQTDFSKKADSVESVTLTKENDAWRVAGYFIQ